MRPGGNMMIPLLRELHYYPFGSVMQGRVYSSGAYRFGFVGQEKMEQLDEAYSFLYRIHEARLGRFLSVDPLMAEYPWNSNYCYAENDVIRSIDIEGAEKYVVIRCWDGDKFRGTVCLYLPDKGTTRVFRGNHARANQTMILNLKVTDSEMGVLRGDVFKRQPVFPGSSNKEVIGLTDAANNILFTYERGVIKERQDASFVDESPNNSESTGVKSAEIGMETGQQAFANRMIKDELREFYYEFNQSATITLSEDQISAYKNYLDKNPDYVINVVGHTDKKGDETYNEQLGLDRATDVKKYLTDLGIDGARIKVSSKGESEATVDESASNEARQIDRKVTIQWTPPPIAP